MRIATWSTKQAVAPNKPLPELWQWLEHTVQADVAEITEARTPKTGPPPGWQALWTPGDIGPRRTWGTVLAGRAVTNQVGGGMPATSRPGRSPGRVDPAPAASFGVRRPWGVQAGGAVPLRRAEAGAIEDRIREIGVTHVRFSEVTLDQHRPEEVHLIEV